VDLGGDLPQFYGCCDAAGLPARPDSGTQSHLAQDGDGRIRQDPNWKNGEYTTEPRAGLQISTDFLLIAGSAPLAMQKDIATRDSADKYLNDYTKRVTARLDANDFLYAVNASRNYDPSQRLGTIVAPVMFVNSADDFINPPELGIAEREIKKVNNGRFVLIPASDQTHGHGTHTWAMFWQQYLNELLKSSQP